MPLKYAFLGFFEKNLKVKIAYLGGFSANNEKNRHIFGEKNKSLFYKSALTFSLGGLEK